MALARREVSEPGRPQTIPEMIADMQAGIPLKRSIEHRKLAARAMAALDRRKPTEDMTPEEITAWANRLAYDLAKYAD